MNAKKLEFSLLPHRLKVHMANMELLIQPSQTLRHGKEALDRKVKAAATVSHAFPDHPELSPTQAGHEETWKCTALCRTPRWPLTKRFRGSLTCALPVLW